MIGATDAGLEPVRASAVLRARRTNLEALAPGLMDRVLGRYARHSLLRNPDTEQPWLLVYLNRLGRDLAALRLLWLGPPRLDELARGSSHAADDADRAVAGRVISDAGIEAIQAYTKAVSHNVEFLRAIHAGDDQADTVRFGGLILLARFISQPSPATRGDTAHREVASAWRGVNWGRESRRRPGVAVAPWSGGPGGAAATQIGGGGGCSGPG